MRRDRADMRLDRPLRESDLRDMVKRGGPDLTYLLLARDIHARRQAGAAPTQAPGAADPSSTGSGAAEAADTPDPKPREARP